MKILFNCKGAGQGMVATQFDGGVGTFERWNWAKLREQGARVHNCAQVSDHA